VVEKLILLPALRQLVSQQKKNFHDSKTLKCAILAPQCLEVFPNGKSNSVSMVMSVSGDEWR